MKYGYYDEKESPLAIEEYTDGANIIVLRAVNNFISTSIKLEDSGWELRDSIKVLLQKGSLHATLFRKPFKGTVANNVLTNGCGGININACRISYGESGSIASNPLLRKKKGYSHKSGTDENSSNIKIKSEESQFQVNETGRFPANLLLECTCKKVIEGKSEGAVINKKNSKSINDTIYKLGHSKGEQEAPRAYKDTGATHTDSNCPCKKLDMQSGISKSTGGSIGTATGYGNNFAGSRKNVKGNGGLGDVGGASRFFFSFKSKDELKEYLTALIRC